MVVLVILFFSRKLWAGTLVSMIKNRKKYHHVVDTNDMVNSVIFQPSGTIRTFSFSLDIEENGDGTVKIAIAKLKDKVV